MNKKDKEEFVGLIAEAIDKVVVPALDAMESRLTETLASKEDVREVGMKVDSLDRKFDAQQSRLDRHNLRIEKLEEIHQEGKHSLATG